MSKRGRPRKHRHREPSGRGSRAEENRSTLAFARWQRRNLLGILEPGKLLDPLAGTPLGVLRLTSEISEKEYEAGELYRHAVLTYRRISGLSFGLIAGINSARGGDEKVYDPEDIKKSRRHMARLKAILYRAGSGVAGQVHGVCYNYEKPSDLALLKRGLKAILRRVPT